MNPPLRQQGFSLIEVLCAILVLGVGVVGLTVGLSTALTHSKDSEVQTTAVLLAAGRLEELRAEGYVLPGDLDGEGGAGLSDYSWSESIVETDVEGLYHVQIVVSHGGRSVYTLETLLFDPPISSDLEDDPELKERRARREREDL